MAERRTTSHTQTVLTYPPHWFNPEEWLKFVELSPFTRRWDELGLTDKDMACVQAMIMLDPKGPPVIEGTGGLRKMRCGRRDSAKGKSAGYRICYVYFKEFGTVLMVTIYPKNEQDAIPETHKAVIRRTIERIHKEMSNRPHRLGPRAGREEEK